MRYLNRQTEELYNEGDTLTRRLDNGSVFSGVPSAEQLEAWGFEEWTPTPAPAPSAEELERQQWQERLQEIEQELKGMDYLTSKYIDGEDMSQYGDWQGRRRQLRQEYREIEEILSELS